MKTVGVLALQGDFEAHRKAIERVGAKAVEVRTAAELSQCDGLIIPGGESSTMLKLLEIGGLTEPILEFAGKKPVYGSCAGAILLARGVTRPAQASFGLMDIDVERNAYGRQIDSRIANIEPILNGTIENAAGDKIACPTIACPTMEAVFIRAPIIRRVGDGARVLASYQGDPVWVEDGRHMVTTFHPELTEDDRVHRRFLEKL
jgi:pyridoxal 5'-phosphate synthase pdxT subunit